MKKEYSKPVVAEERFALVDVVTTSPAGSGTDQEDGDDDE